MSMVVGHLLIAARGCLARPISSSPLSHGPVAILGWSKELSEGAVANRALILEQMSMAMAS